MTTAVAHNVAGKRSHMLVALKDVEQLQETQRQIDECNTRYKLQIPTLQAQVRAIDQRLAALCSAAEIPEYYRLLGEKQKREKRIVDIQNQIKIEDLKVDVDRVYGYLKTSGQFTSTSSDGDAPAPVLASSSTGSECPHEGSLSDDEDQVDTEISAAPRSLASRKRKLSSNSTINNDHAGTSVADEIECLMTENKRFKADHDSPIAASDHPVPNNMQVSHKRMREDEDAATADPVETDKKRARIEEATNSDPNLSLHAGMMAIVKRRNLLEDVRTTPCYNLRQFCEKCRSPYINSTEESKLICTKCENSISVIDSTPATVAFAAESENQQYSYERFTHLMNKLEPFEARREMKIEQEAEVLDSVKYLYRQNRFFTKGEITFDKMNMFLKFLKYYHLYKAKYAITMKFNKKWWPIITDYEQLKLVLAFLVFQESFENVKKNSRSSYFKYEFSLFHKCNMLNIKRCLPYLRLLETKERHQKQLALLRRIVKMHGWPYNPVM